MKGVYVGERKGKRVKALGAMAFMTIVTPCEMHVHTVPPYSIET